MRASSSFAVFVVASLVTSAAAIGACSGRTESGNPTSPTNDAGPGSATKNHPDCPAADPGEGAACNKDGLLCEYGDDFDPRCNALRVCSGGRYAGPILFGGGGKKCGAPPPVVPTNSADCPASKSAITEGQACTPKGTTCHFDGAQCACGAFCPTVPVGRPPCDPDAGVTMNCCDQTRSDWHCFAGPSFCKAQRPRIGSPCTTEGETCAITEPAECGQSTIACKGGVWTIPNSACPVSTAKAKADIAYVDDAARAALHAQTMAVRLATYRYTTPASDGAPHLGFIIEDMPPGSPAVLRSREQADLYGFVSLAVASLQEHERKLGALEDEVARLRRENEALRMRSSGTK